jgi:hypothetical protein
MADIQREVNKAKSGSIDGDTSATSLLSTLKIWLQKRVQIRPIEGEQTVSLIESE